MGPPAFWYKVLIHMTVGTTFPRKILNNGKEPCEPFIVTTVTLHIITNAIWKSASTKSYF